MSFTPRWKDNGNESVSLIELVLTGMCGGFYPQLNICAFLKQSCHVVILVFKCVSSVMRGITNSELLGCIVFWQVLKAHPNYPKIRKEILDKARASLRNWICFLYDSWSFASQTVETMNKILQWQRPHQQKNTVDMMNITVLEIWIIFMKNLQTWKKLYFFSFSVLCKASS